MPNNSKLLFVLAISLMLFGCKKNDVIYLRCINDTEAETPLIVIDLDDNFMFVHFVNKDRKTEELENTWRKEPGLYDKINITDVIIHDLRKNESEYYFTTLSKYHLQVRHRVNRKSLIYRGPYEDGIFTEYSCFIIKELPLLRKHVIEQNTNVI